MAMGTWERNQPLFFFGGTFLFCPDSKRCWHAKSTCIFLVLVVVGGTIETRKDMNVHDIFYMFLNITVTMPFFVEHVGQIQFLDGLL